MTVEIYDTSTGAALTVREVAASLAVREVTAVPQSWAEAIDAHQVATRGRTFSAALSQMRAAMLLAAGRLDELGIGRSLRRVGEPGPEPVPAELPADPALELTPERLDAEARRRRELLAPLAARPRFVPTVPAKSRRSRAGGWVRTWLELTR